MRPARLSAGWIGRVSSSSRNLVVVCAATIGGIVIGGVSGLGVAIVVIEPPAHDAPAGSAVFDGRAHVVQQAPTASSATPQTAAASPPTAPPATSQAQPVRPVEAQVVPPAQQQTPAQILDKTWPDAPPARPSRAPQSTAAGPAPNAAASSVASNAQPQTMTTRTVTPRTYSQIPVAPNPDTTNRRVVVIPDDTDVASAGSSSRPLFDFFGTFGDERQRDDRNVVSVPPPPPPQPQSRASRNPRDPQLVIRHRQDSDDDNQEAVNSSPPPQYDSWDNFFAYSRNDNWHN